jgi:hypothetical protein
VSIVAPFDRVCDLLIWRCLVLVIWRTESDFSGTLAFRPANGTVRVGETTEIECVLTGAAGASNASNASNTGQFGLVDLLNRSSLLSTDTSSPPARAKPPHGQTSYTNSGWTVIQCTYAGPGGVELVKNLTVRVLRESCIVLVFFVSVQAEDGR